MTDIVSGLGGMNEDGWNDLISSGKVHMYKVTAAYRPNNTKKPSYYVWGKNKVQAKRELLKLLGEGFKIYSIEELSVYDAILREAVPEFRPFNSPLNYEWAKRNDKEVVECSNHT